MGTGSLSAAIDELLDLDPTLLDDAALHDTVVELSRQTHRLAAARARLLARWDARGAWAADGSRSAAARLSRDAHTSVGAAKVELRRARALRDMAHTATALSEGGLSTDHVDLLAAANRDGAAVSSPTTKRRSSSVQGAALSGCSADGRLLASTRRRRHRPRPGRAGP